MFKVVIYQRDSNWIDTYQQTSAFKSYQHDKERRAQENSDYNGRRSHIYFKTSTIYSTYAPCAKTPLF